MSDVRFRLVMLRLVIRVSSLMAILAAVCVTAIYGHTELAGWLVLLAFLVAAEG